MDEDDFREWRGGPRRGGGLPGSRGRKREGASGTPRPAKRRRDGGGTGRAAEVAAVGGGPRGAAPGRRRPRGEKKNRMMSPRTPPTLLLQDPENARRQTEARVAVLLSEVGEFPSTPPLPPSRLLESDLSGKADGPVAVPSGAPPSLWERSSLVGLSAPGPACVAGSTLPWRTDQSTPWPLLGSVRPEAEEMLHQGRGGGEDHQGRRAGKERQGAEGCGPEEAEALRDLMELAGEGLTLTQWNPPARQGEERGQEWMPGDVPRSDRDQSPEETFPLGSSTPPVLLGSLAAAFRGMVNNPHLSDVQLQVDSGELFYAHMFVLYARCPQLMEVVDQKGFWVAEEGEGETRRVLLSHVSGEAARVFLDYLYAAEHLIPPRVLSDVAALAARFGVPELAALCASHGWGGRPAAVPSGQEEGARVEKLEELLKSIWVGEEEEDRAVPPEELGSEKVVDEQELEEIYEFAATQRAAEEERRCRERSRGAVGGADPMEEGTVPGDPSEGKRSPSPSCLQGRGARREAVPGLPLAAPRGAEEQRPLGAASRSPLEGLLEGDAALRELGEQSLRALSWDGSLELFQQSYNGEEPSSDAAGEDGAVVTSSTPLGLEKGLVPASQNFSSGGSWVPGRVLADELPASPQRRGGFCSDVSLALFSPALQEASGRPCQIDEQELPKLQRVAASERAASSGADNTSSAPAPWPSSPSDLEGGLLPMPDPEDAGVLSQGERQGEMMGCPSKEQEGFGARNGRLRMPVDLASCRQGTGAPLLGGGADAGGERTWEAVIPSAERQSLQGWLPLGHRPPPPRSSACLPKDGPSVADVVVILDDSEEEAEAAPRWPWGSSALEAALPGAEGGSSHLFHVASPGGSVATKAGSCPLSSPPRSSLMQNSTPPGRSPPAGFGPLPRFGYAEEESGSSGGSRRRGLDVRDQGGEPETLPLTQRRSAPVPVPKTPDLTCREEGAACATPPTPMPSYSIMETPVLKRELRRFGVRALPKKQMVLKLKEIFQHTHQRADSGGQAASSQSGWCCRTQAALSRPASAAAHSGLPKEQPSYPELPWVLLAGGRFGGSSGAGDRGQGRTAQQGCLPAGSGRRKGAAEGLVRGGRALPASQKAASGPPIILQSSSTEFETSMLAEEEDDAIPTSQSTRREADTVAALRQYIHSRPALCRQILFYQPLELARLQSELKQSGLRIALGRLRGFLDAQGITFTTAAARREKRQLGGGRGGGERY